MKKIKHLLWALIAFLIVSCSSDEDKIDADSDAALIVGQWVITNQIYNGQDENLSDCQLQETYTFNADGTSISYYEDTVPGEECQFYTDSQIYILIGEELSIKFGDDSDFRFNIVKLNKTELTLENYSRNDQILEEDNRTTYQYKRVK